MESFSEIIETYCDRIDNHFKVCQKFYQAANVDFRCNLVHSINEIERELEDKFDTVRISESFSHQLNNKAADCSVPTEWCITFTLIYNNLIHKEWSYSNKFEARKAYIDVNLVFRRYKVIDENGKFDAVAHKSIEGITCPYICISNNSDAIIGLNYSKEQLKDKLAFCFENDLFKQYEELLIQE